MVYAVVWEAVDVTQAAMTLRHETQAKIVCFSATITAVISSTSPLTYLLTYLIDIRVNFTLLVPLTNSRGI